MFFDWACDGQLANMDMARIRCRRSGALFDHSKLMTIDGEWCATSSANWGIRSMRQNFEILVECHDREMVSRIDAVIDAKAAQSVEYQISGSGLHQLPRRLRNASARLLMPYL